MGITSHRNCNAIIIIFALSLLVSILCGCDPYADKRPTAYPSSKWVCQDPDIIFTVSEKKELHWKLNGVETDYELILGMGRNFWIHDNNTGLNLLEGDSSYSSQKMTVIVSMDNLFDGKYEGRQIVFKRVE